MADLDKLYRDTLPKIDAASISLVKPFVLPNFMLQRTRINYPFLLSERSYSLFYLKGERSKRYQRYLNPEAQHLPQEIRVKKVGRVLVPMSTRHTLRSFWKAFRLRYQRESPLNEENARELFSFLPLKMKLPINNIVISSITYPVRIRAYLFPFGVCCVNLQMEVHDVSYYFDEFIDLLQKLGRYTFEFNAGRIHSNFNGFAKSIAEDVNTELFGESSPLIPNPMHTILFIKKTTKELLFDIKAQNLANIRRGIAALLSCNKFIANSSNERIEELLNSQLQSAPGHEDEILLFTKEGTLIYPSSNWINEVLERKRTRVGKTWYGTKIELDDTERRLEQSLRCMHNNYEAVLSLLLSSNAVLYALKGAKGKISKEYRRRWSQKFHRIFPDESQEIDYHYKHAVGKIANEIKLYKNLNEIASSK